MAKIYNSRQVSIVICNIPIRGGYADGEFLRIERDADGFGDVVGTDGEVTRFATNDERAMATLILMQSADANDALDALYESDRNSPLGSGVGEFVCRDGSGRAIYRGQCWIAAKPKVSFAREPGPREWKIRIPNLKSFEGGNLGR